MARCSRYRLDSHGSTAWRSGSKRDSTTRCGRFLCRSRQVRMPGPAGGPAAPMARGRASTQLHKLPASRTSVVCCSYVVLIHEHVVHHGSRFRARARAHTHTHHRGETERARGLRRPARPRAPSPRASLTHTSLLPVVSRGSGHSGRRGVRHLKRKNLFILWVPGGGHADERLMAIKRRVGSSTQGSGARPVKQ